MRLRNGTAYPDLNADPRISEMAIRALAEGNSLRSAARIVEIDKDTACAWLDRAARHCREVMLFLWKDLPVAECQADELWSFVHTKEGHRVTAKRVCESYGNAWIWVAFAPLWRLVLAFVVGDSTSSCTSVSLRSSRTATSARPAPLWCSRASWLTVTAHAARTWSR